jgi:hypothetical protein
MGGRKCSFPPRPFLFCFSHVPFFAVDHGRVTQTEVDVEKLLKLLELSQVELALLHLIPMLNMGNERCLLCCSVEEKHCQICMDVHGL